MSAEAVPITFERFAKALEDLPVSSLYAKHAELTNQIAHLESSNRQLEDFAREKDDRDCYEALLENRQVVKRFAERKELIKKEVQDVRGLPWRPQGEDATVAATEGHKPVAANGAAATPEQRVGAESTDTGVQDRNEEDGVYL